FRVASKMAEVEQKKRTFHKFTYRGVDLDQLLDMCYEQLMQLYSACRGDASTVACGRSSTRCSSA
ncbi:40S ribosomal protein S15, partial [Microtus ochrogaster]